MTSVLDQEQPHSCARRDNDLIDAISLAGHLLEQQLDQALSHHGLTARQHRALRHISLSPGLGRAALAKALRISPQAAGALTQRLCNAGLIDRGFADRGIPISFTLTELGWEHLRKAVPIVAAVERRARAGLPTTRVESLIDAVEALLAGIR